jgi:hypothetical protein
VDSSSTIWQLILKWDQIKNGCYFSNESLHWEEIIGHENNSSRSCGFFFGLKWWWMVIFMTSKIRALCKMYFVNRMSFSRPSYTIVHDLSSNEMHSGTCFGYFQFMDKCLLISHCKTYTKIRFEKTQSGKRRNRSIHKHKTRF